MLALSIEQHSWAHRVPVGWKLAALFCATALVFPLTDLRLLMGCVALAIALYLSLGRAALMIGVAALKPVWWFVVIIALYHGVIGDFSRGMVIVVKMIALLGLANFVTMTSRLSDMMDWVIWALAPLRLVGVKPERIALAFALVIRFIPSLNQRASVLQEAWRARAKRRLGLRIVAPLVISALDDGETTAEALRARGGVE
ncbi:energy-coupling factor transporter transmembrane protein EcfT [Amylibacter sp. IMCC11727]|uniref:energy-coupling factor transporter transmembrane component T family protein n=1 Tax=Amylibacter sp. IMCC11727 TaxID=3039851 RepID=UPI00244DEF5F|nr:energy-coupling factor transporter transmembrane protein EcfT [Amylibacter sp. IMCC11727]WGI23015.1 energy-coupling factor transporter transmembrane protein EcfT [Amylibacter sp. IMCC11727]